MVAATDSHGSVVNGPTWTFTIDNFPDLPSNPSPVTGSSVVGTMQTLSWTGSDPDSNDILHYDVYLDTANPPAIKVFADQTSPSVPAMTFNRGTTYYWKVVATDNHGAAASSPIWSFTVDNLPNSLLYLSPFNGTTVVGVSHTLIWNGGDDVDSGDAVTYDIYFGADALPSMPIAQQTGKSLVVTSLTPGSTYYWKVVATDSHGGMTNGPIWSFTIDRSPSTPLCASPFDGATVTGTTQTLSWTGGDDPDADDTVTYDVYFSDSASFSEPASQQSGKSLELTGLSSGTTYYWKVVATDNHGVSSSSPIWNFGIDSLPNPLLYVSPPNGATVVEVSQTLVWKGGDDDDSGDAVTYDVYLGAGVLPSTPVAQQSDKTLSVTDLSSGDTYYWMVTATDSHGGVVNGPTWTFTIDNFPAEPSNPSPATGATVVGVSPTLSWTGGGDPDVDDTVTYDVQFGTDNPPITTVAMDQSAPSLAMPHLTPDVTYYWRVIAKDNHGATTQSPTWLFTVTADLTVPAAPYGLVISNEGSSSLSVWWTRPLANGSAAVTLYNVYRADAVDGTYTLLGNTATSSSTFFSYNDLTVSNGYSYFYRVAAVNSVGEGLLSAAISGTPTVEKHNSWQRKADFPGGARRAPVSFAINGKGYLGSGNLIPNNAFATPFYEYDPGVDTWYIRSAGWGRDTPGGAATNDRGYITGGWDTWACDVQEFNPTNNTWTTKTDYRTGCSRDVGPVALSINGTLYIGGGDTNGGTYYNGFYMFNADSNNWTARANLPVTVGRASVGFSIGDFGYIIDVATRVMYRFDPALNSWTVMADYPVGLSGPAKFVIDGIAYVGVGGDNRVYTYNPDTNVWTLKTYFPGSVRSQVGSFMIDGKGYVSQAYPANVADLWVYVP